MAACLEVQGPANRCSRSPSGLGRGPAAPADGHPQRRWHGPEGRTPTVRAHECSRLGPSSSDPRPEKRHRGPAFVPRGMEETRPAEPCLAGPRTLRAGSRRLFQGLRVACQQQSLPGATCGSFRKCRGPFSPVLVAGTRAPSSRPRWTPSSVVVSARVCPARATSGAAWPWGAGRQVADDRQRALRSALEPCWSPPHAPEPREGRARSAEDTAGTQRRSQTKTARGKNTEGQHPLGTQMQKFSSKVTAHQIQPPAKRIKPTAG